LATKGAFRVPNGSSAGASRWKQVEDLGVATALNFPSIGNGKAGITGDFVLLK